VLVKFVSRLHSENHKRKGTYYVGTLKQLYISSRQHSMAITYVMK
jgi:hypothetical protein